MDNQAEFLVFLAAAGALALMPGPGLLNLTARTLSEGRPVGLKCCVGSFGGGLVHVAAGSAGLSAVLLASPTAFNVLKLVGGFYLLWLAWKTWHRAGVTPSLPATPGCGGPVIQGFIVEYTNPKTALFFLALIPQFIDVKVGHVAMQFIALGVVSVVLNTAAALLVIFTVGTRQLNNAEHRATKLGIRSLHVVVGNRARSFYEVSGFLFAATVETAFSHAVRMRKALS